MRIASAYDEGLLDSEHAADSIRAALAKIRGGRHPAAAAAADDETLWAWNNARLRFLRSTDEVGELVASDARAQNWFHDRIRATQNELSRYIGQ